MKKKITVALMAAMALPVMADEAIEQSNIDSLKMMELQELQVVSTRATKTTPVAHDDITKEEIKELNVGKDLPTVLSSTPSVTFTSDAGNGIGYTTVNVRGSDGTRVNVTANGIPINDAESSAVFWVNMPDFLSSAETVQIQRGVGTSTNGAGAFGATINIQTEKIGMKPFIGVDLSGGSYYSHKETLRFGTGLLGEHWGLQGRVSNIGTKGYLDRAKVKLWSYFVQGGYFNDDTAIRFITFNGKEETYHAWNYTSEYEQQLYGRTYNSCGEYYDENGNRHYYDNQTDNYRQQHYQLLWDQNLPMNLKYNLALHYTHGKGYYEQYMQGQMLSDYQLVPADDMTMSDVVRQMKMDNDFFGFVSSLNYDNKNGLTAIFGGGWNRYIGDNFGVATWAKVMAANNKEFYRNRARKNDGNIYAKLNYEFLRGLSAFLDMQYRHVSVVMHGPTASNVNGEMLNLDYTRKFDFFNPKVGLNYQITPDHRVYVSYARGNKEPTRNDYLVNLVNNNEVKHETLNDLELGYGFTSPTFTAGANFYYMHYKNQIVLSGNLNDIGEALKENVPKSYRLGMELEAAWKPLQWFQWSANATLSKNRVKDWYVTLDDGTEVGVGDTRLSFSPSFICNNIFAFMYDGFKAEIRNRWISRQYLTNSGFLTCQADILDDNYNVIGSCENKLYIPGYFNTDITLSYTTKALKKLAIKEATLGLTLYNIFNTYYFNNGWASPSFRKNSEGKVEAYGYETRWTSGFAPSAPFNFMFNLSVNF